MAQTAAMHSVDVGIWQTCAERSTEVKCSIVNRKRHQTAANSVQEHHSSAIDFTSDFRRTKVGGRLRILTEQAIPHPN